MKFCGECGTTLHFTGTGAEPKLEQTTARLTPEPERKHVTALFSDLTGYTAMTEKLDPEQVKEITGRIFTGVKQIVSKYEGFIERVMGDGVLAFFGVPRSHEDDPTRAVRAAMEIHALVKAMSPDYEALVGSPLTMHSGINTGLVVTADVDQTRGTQGIAGDAVNVASRLSGLAGPGEILVGEETFRSAKNHVVFDDLGPKRVKGKAEPITVFKVVSVKASTPGSTTDRQVSSEMVGRDKELDRLELQVMKAINGEGSVVNVVGEAGIGKSRLIAELRKRDPMKKVTLLEGRAISIGRNLSFHPIIDLLKQWAGIAEDDSETVRFDKLERAIRAIHPEETNEILPFVATLMGMKLRGKHAERVKGIEGESLEKIIFKNVRELIIKGSELRPTLVVMEDLHWADESSLGLLESLYRLVENHRVLFINLFRPGYWQSEHRTVERISELFPHHHVEIAVQPLDKQASDTLIGNMLDIKGLPYSLRIQIGERAGGNPFFIEEVVRSLIDEGAIVRTNGAFEVTDRINSVVIPSTINDVLMARIHRLEDQTRDLVKVASVIGRSFFDRILKDVASSIEGVDHRLAYLKDVQLIRDHMRMEELEYLFKHALAQEVAYESTLLQQRKTLHLKVAQSIEKLFHECLPEFYGMLAYHYNKAEDQEKAEYWMTKAGEEALRSSASSEALYYYKEALRLYVDKYGDAADPEKLANFEKNIALAHYNKGQYSDAVPYFDMVLRRWGVRLPKNQVGIAAKLAYDLLMILLRLYLPFSGPKKIPDQRVNDFFDFLLIKDKALLMVSPKRLFAETIGEFRESLKYDLTRLDIAAAFHLATGAIFSFSGSFRMSELVLGNAGRLVDKKKIQDVVSSHLCTTVHKYCAGRWAEIPEYDDLVFDLGMKHGLFIDSNAYLLFQGLFKTRQGKLNWVADLWENLIAVMDKFQVRTPGILNAEFMVVSRRLTQAQTAANYSIARAVEMGSGPFEFMGLGWRAVAQVLMNDIAAVKDSLTRANQIRLKRAFWPPWQLASTLLAQFMLNLDLLENAIGGDSRSLISKHSKAALTSGKAAVKNSAKFAAHRTENYRLMGVYYWLTGKQRKALNWFDKSIKEGERLGARPDLSRTYMEVGKRLLEPKSKYKELNGITATEYLEKAETMFRDMNLEWDLEQLERVRR
jgi:class 3 adenylate cyclase/tetratricopeptide (TPR) repeat protein